MSAATAAAAADGAVAVVAAAAVAAPIAATAAALDAAAAVLAARLSLADPREGGQPCPPPPSTDMPAVPCGSSNGEGSQIMRILRKPLVY